VSERIRTVQHRRRFAAEAAHDIASGEQVPYKRLAAGDQLVRSTYQAPASKRPSRNSDASAVARSGRTAR